MYIRQKGAIAVVTRLVGLALSGIFTFGVFRAITWLLARDYNEISNVIVFGLVWLVALYYAVWFHAWFPDLLITKNGVKYRYFSIFSGESTWEEIIGIKKIRNQGILNGQFALLIKKRKFAILHPSNYYQILNSLIVNADFPTIFISFYYEDHEVFLALKRKDEVRE